MVWATTAAASVRVVTMWVWWPVSGSSRVIWRQAKARLRAPSR
jgi:hypothetical protein